MLSPDAICSCESINEHAVSCPHHPRNKQQPTSLSLQAFHVLAKVTSDRTSSPEQTHFFVKAPTAARAIALVEDRLGSPTPIGAVVEKQFVVNEAQNRGSTGMAAGEELYSL